MGNRKPLTLWSIICLVVILGLLFLSCAPKPTTEAPKPTTAAPTTAAPKPTTAAPTTAAPKPTTPAEVIKLKYATYYVKGAHDAVITDDWWMDEIEKRTAGRVKFERYYAGALAKATDMTDSVSKGLAQIGETAPAYTPALFPLVAGLTQPFATSSVYVMQRAENDMEKTPAGTAEWTKANLKHLTATAAGVTYLISKSPVERLEDFQGKKFRSYGAMNTAIGLLGGTAVAIALTEVYSALQTGLINGAISSLADLDSQKMQEQAKYVIDAKLGGFGCNVLIMHLPTYNGLPADVRDVIDKVSSEYMDKNLQVKMDLEKKLVTALKTQGLTFSMLSESESARWRAKVVPQLWDNWINEKPELTQQRKEFFTQWQAAIKKWAATDKYVHPFTYALK